MRYIQILIAMAVSLLMGSVFTSFPKVFAEEKEPRTYKEVGVSIKFPKSKRLVLPLSP